METRFPTDPVKSHICGCILVSVFIRLRHGKNLTSVIPKNTFPLRFLEQHFRLFLLELGDELPHPYNVHEGKGYSVPRAVASKYQNISKYFIVLNKLFNYSSCEPKTGEGTSTSNSEFVRMCAWRLLTFSFWYSCLELKKTGLAQLFAFQSKRSL